MRKSYLSQQIKLMTLSTTDLLTEEEFALYQRIIEILNELDRMETEAKRNHTKVKAEQKSNLLEEKHAVQAQLNNKIQEYENKPRTVRVSGVVDTRNVERITGNNTIPDGIAWPFLRNSRKIAEFASDMSRTMGLSANDVTFDKIIIKWKSADMLKQIVINGFFLPLLKEDGSVEHRKFQIVTASAGQLRRDKVQAISESMWDKIKAHIQCGLDWDEINRRGGLNLSKLFAYTALSSSATDPWPEIDIDKVVVVKDFETEVSGLVDYIHPDYTIERGVHAVPIKHTDGCGMARPDVLDRNQMIRAPYIKGLVTPFDFVRFCLEHGVKPEIEDLWGIVHDLVAEDIQLIITASMFKLWKYYKDWDEYKICFKKYGCSFCRTNCEENYIPDTTVNYQFLETLTDFTDEELKVFTQKTLNKINNIANNMTSMLQTLNADEFSDVPYKKALSLYPPLLRDGYSKESLKEIKKRWTLDAQSGRLHCENKRLFAIPDIYACCEFWFLHDENPKGLLKNGEVACRIYRMYDKVDCLRSPHLYMEHALRNISHDQNVYRWLNSYGIYTSCHDLITRILQFDCDGDQLNCVVNKVLIDVAERNLKNNNIVPLYYAANDAPKEVISRENIYIGLKRAHDCSGIGQISNNLCKLWNSDHPNYESAALLCYYNNQVNSIAPSCSDA